GRGPPPPTGHGARSYAGTVPVRVPTAARRTGRGSVRGGHDRAFLPLRTAAVAAGPPPPLRRHGPRRLAPPRRPAGDLVDGGADRRSAAPSVDPAVPLADGAHGHPRADHHLDHGVGAALRRGAADDPPRRGVPPPAGAPDPAAQRGRAGDDPGDAARVAVGGG